MHQRERRLARHEDQLPPFLERHVGGALDQRARGAGRDGGHGAHGAGADHHAAGPLGARCGKRAPVAVGERGHRRPVAAGGGAQRLQRPDAALRLEEPHPVSRRDQPDGNLVPRQDLEQADAVRRARGAGESEDDGMADRHGAHPGQAIDQGEEEHGDAHDAVHREEGGVEAREVARAHQAVLVGQNRRPPPPGPRSTRGRIPCRSRTAPAPGWSRRAAAWRGGSRATRRGGRRRFEGPHSGRTPRPAGRRRCRIPPPRSPRRRPPRRAAMPARSTGRSPRDSRRPARWPD